MHLYAFGSVCRGEIDAGSDIDLLAIVAGRELSLDAEKFSIYSYRRIEELWKIGNPFAWHLSLESKLLFASDSSDFLASLGKPQEYKDYVHDCEKFGSVFQTALNSLRSSTGSETFDLSSMFLGIRNLATCYLLGVEGQPEFSRHAARKVEAAPLTISNRTYNTLERARLMCTRATGDPIRPEEISEVLNEADELSQWVNHLQTKARDHDRVREPGRSAAKNPEASQ